MMKKDRPNKIPRPGTIAKHYAQGKYCDYPSDILFEAVNNHDYDYNPTAIPIRIGFRQTFIANFNALVYLCEHRNEAEINAFLSDPNGFMSEAGVDLLVPFDDIAPKIFATLVEDDMLDALRDPEGHKVCGLVYSREPESWRYRHPERYDRNYMKRDCFFNLYGIPSSFDKDFLEASGFNDHMGVNLLFIADFFAED